MKKTNVDIIKAIIFESDINNNFWLKLILTITYTKNN